MIEEILNQKTLSSVSMFQSTLAKSLKLVENQYSALFEKFNQDAIEVIVAKGSEFSKYDMNSIILQSERTSSLQEVTILAIITSSTLLECLINWVLQAVFGKSNGYIKDSNLKDKWFNTPKEYFPTYSVPDSVAKKYEVLMKSRNAIIHHKPIIEYADGSTNKGTMLDVFGSSTDGRIAQIAFSLPVELCTALLTHSDKGRHFYIANGMLDVFPKSKDGGILIPPPQRAV